MVPGCWASTLLQSVCSQCSAALDDLISFDCFQSVWCHGMSYETATCGCRQMSKRATQRSTENLHGVTHGWMLSMWDMPQQLKCSVHEKWLQSCNYLHWMGFKQQRAWTSLRLTDSWQVAWRICQYNCKVCQGHLVHGSAGSSVVVCVIWAYASGTISKVVWQSV